MGKVFPDQSAICLCLASTRPDAGTARYWPCSDYIGSNGLTCFRNASCCSITLRSKQIRTQRIVAFDLCVMNVIASSWLEVFRTGEAG